MKFERNLILSATKQSWRMSHVHGTVYDRGYRRPNSKIKTIWDEVWKRDKNTCFYCQFKSDKYQEIHHLNDNHDDNTMDNLVTICPLCHMSFHLDIVSDNNSGKIIWLPDFTQQELNYIVRAIFIATYAKEKAEKEKTEVPNFVKIADMIYNSLEERERPVEQRVLKDASNPIVFASALINMTEKQYEERGESIAPFKLLCSINKFTVQTAYWANVTYKGMPVETWEKLIKTTAITEDDKEELDEELKNENIGDMINEED